MIKILFLVSTLKQSGPTNQLFYIIKNLNFNKFDVHILTLSPEPIGNSLKFMFKKLGVQLHSLGLTRIEGLFFAKKKFKEFLLQLYPEIVHSQGIRADTLNAVSFPDIYSITTARNYPLFDYPLKYGRILGRIVAYKHISALKSLHVVSCSYDVSSELAKHSINSAVIQNGVDEIKYSPVSKLEKQSLRTKLGIPVTYKIFITVGSLIPRKDVKTILAAFQSANISKKSFLIIVGDGVQMLELKNMNVRSSLFSGSVNNVDEYLKSSDFYISASHAEGLPNTVLEAMACNLTCVLSDIPPHRELCDSEDVFFKCGSVKELSHKIRSFAECSSCSKASYTRDLVENYFSSWTMSEKYQSIYTCHE